MNEMNLSRHNQRIIALQILYSLDIKNKFDIDFINEELKKINAARENFNIFKKNTYFKKIIEGVIEHQKKLDKKIDNFAIDWDLKRINTLDKNILRIALWELGEEIPVGVAINEAVELAKEFNGKKSAAFINGILGKSVNSSY